jgi:non-ribosomal peptide synthetase component F
MSAQPLNDCRIVLGAAVADLDLSPNSRTPIIDGERRRILSEWNDTNRNYPRDHRLHRLIEEQVARTPGAVALTCGDRSLTYRELNSRANRLAHHLRSLGVVPGALVGLFAERSPEMVVGLLGILKAGGAYVPLDPDYPAGRLGLMLEDARPAVVLTQEHLEARLPASQARILRLDRDWDLVAAHDEGDPDGGVRPEDLAYVIYTSGSTGVPKGAMNTHEGICNRLLWMQEAYGLTVEDRVLQKTPYSFDVSVWEFF